ncbi:unnamed protein product [marine sediment metagenome]|uniref:Uncharacterized protein n=1 Tax=marine sediment metagenome TaxID=412755 RepID=X1HKF1_9ZZZZ
MLTEIFHVLNHAIMITGFVFVMMLVIEYINVQTNGIWQNKISGSKWRQYIFAAMLGAIPGCLGAFTVVALFSHRMLSFGAIVAAMIATSGDEAFVMFAMFPQKAALITVIILIIGILAGCIINKSDINPQVSGEIEEFLNKENIIHFSNLPYDEAFTNAMTNGQTIVEYDQNNLTAILTDSWNMIKQTVRT